MTQQPDVQPAPCGARPPEDVCVALASCAVILAGAYATDPRSDDAALLRSMGDLNLVAEWPFGGVDELAAVQELLQVGAQVPVAVASDEYRRLFVGPGHLDAPPWGSVYLDKDQIRFGASELELRQWMRENGIEAHDDRLGREPMDHVAAMLSLLGWLARERPELLETYLGRHLLPWVFRYLDCLEESAQQPFYQGLAGLTRLTLVGAAGDLGVTAQRRTLFW